jgi:hypothetical protein
MVAATGFLSLLTMGCGRESAPAGDTTSTTTTTSTAPTIPDFVQPGAPPVAGRGWEVVDTVEPTGDEGIIRLDVLEPGNKVVELADGSARPYTAEDAANQTRFVYDGTRLIRIRMGSWSSTKLDELAAVLAVRYTAERLGKAVVIDVSPGVINSEVAAVLRTVSDAGFDEIRFDPENPLESAGR